MYYFQYESPIGILTFVSYQQHLIRIEFGSWQEKQGKIVVWLSKHALPTQLTYSKEPFRDVINQVEEYFQGERATFSIPYTFYGTAFQKKVWQALATKVEYGRTCSYQDIADHIDSPKAVRAVGGANNKNPLSIIVPCHRVIGKSGSLVGYGGGLDKKEYLLGL